GRAAGEGPLELAYHFDLRPGTVLSLSTWCGGALLFAALPWLRPAIGRALSVAGRVGPGALYDALVDALGRTARVLHDLEVRLLRPRLAHTLIPTAALVALAFFLNEQPSLRIGAIGRGDLPVLVGLAVASGAALATISTASDTAMVLSLTVVGFSLAALFTLLHAPEVALVASLVETTSTILLLAFVMPLPSRRERAAPARRPWIMGISSVLAAGFAFVVTWEMLSRPARQSVASQYVELTLGRGVVGTILSDYRGLDTAGEITVIALSLASVAVLLRPGRRRGVGRVGAGR
ncbi:MAG TPA: hydrogen gas-evolving membrane-bound hydrogenase subunit E, partial [Vulgatibacter sp.]